MNRILFVTQSSEDAIDKVNQSVIKELNKVKHNFNFFQLNKKWENKIEIIKNYIVNSFKLIIKSIKYEKIYFSRENPYALLIKILFPKKEIIMCVHHVEDYWKDTLVWKIIFKKIDKFVTVSEFTQKQLIDNWVNKEKIFVNYNGINEEFFPDKSSNFQYNNYILYVWSEAKRKNLETLINAFKICIDRYPNLKLIKLWPSFFKEEENKNNELVKELKLENNVIFIRDFVPYDELRMFYSNAICYVSVSKLEWFGLTIPEALACGCPVVASDIPVFNEILWNSQIIVNPDNQNEIAEWILKYIEDNKFRNENILEWIKKSKTFTRKDNIYTLINNI